jgi:putative aldouronate transport system permease protein
VTMFIMRCGQIMSVGHEKIILLMTPSTQEEADVISTFVYRMVFANPNPQYSFSAAVGLFNSVVNFALVIIANTVSKKLSNTSLW